MEPLQVVYMDEPSTGLDPASRYNLWNVVKQSKANRAIILTSLLSFPLYIVLVEMQLFFILLVCELAWASAVPVRCTRAYELMSQTDLHCLLKLLLFLASRFETLQ